MDTFSCDDSIHEDFDIFNSIKNEYNIYNQEEYNIVSENILQEIYILKKNINIKKKLINNINNKISSIKNNFLIETNKWTLNDSCNIIKLDNKIRNIIEVHNIISELNYDKEDIELIIENKINNINTIIANLFIENTRNIKCEVDDYDYDELNSIING
tara:strand:- start:1737 stop:2210 length:474 start_codon:yes stop_codon:yes gene_type:complete